MRHRTIISLVLVVIFISPMLSNNGTFLSNDNNYSGIPESMTNYVNSADSYSGTGPSLPVTISGQVSNSRQGTLLFDSSSSGVSSVTLTEGWTGTDLQTEIDSLSWIAEDVLENSDLNDYHNEQFIVHSDTSYNGEAVQVPDSWALVKDSPGETYQHPKHGVYELDSDPNGYSSTRGIYLESQWDSSFSHDTDEEIFIRQMISVPWREVYSAQVSFRYRVDSSTDMADQVHLFVRIGEYVAIFNVFETGDTMDTWLTASTPVIPASSMTGLSTHSLLFDIGLASDLVGQTLALNAYASIDDIQLDFDVRPFPEQIDLKANGTLVWGSTSDSVFTYVPDNDYRDCYDGSSGIDMDGYGSDGGLGVGIYSSSFQIGTFCG